MTKAIRDIHIIPTNRKRIDLTLPIIVLDAIEKISDRQGKTRTQFIEDSLRETLNNLHYRIKGEIEHADLTDDDLKTEKPKFKRLYGEQNGIRNYQRVFGTDQQRRAIERQDTAMSKLWETPIANNAL